MQPGVGYASLYSGSRIFRRTGIALLGEPAVAHTGQFVNTYGNPYSRVLDPSGIACHSGCQGSCPIRVELAAMNPGRCELRVQYPELEDEDIRQALMYAASYMDDRVIELPLSHETTVCAEVAAAQPPRLL